LISLFQAEVIDPALKGTLNVLKSCAKSSSVKRVILTSFVSAIAFNTKLKNPEVDVDETWFSNCRQGRSLWLIVAFNNLVYIFFQEGVLELILPPI
jgi:nucleoside-diphosphate-sugar epimerase